jgi:hypothetical protein
MSMTFEEFQATGRDCEDLRVSLGDEIFEEKSPGRLYGDGLWLQKMPDGSWYTIVFNEDIIDADLATVEKFLYDSTFIDGECVI